MKKVLIFFTVVFAIIVGLSLIMTFSQKVSLRDKVALVRVTGIIIDPTEIIEELKDYSKDTSVKAVVIRVNSPGGGVAPSQEIYEEVRRLKEKKRVIISMGAVAASGGYYIAAPADKIVANAGTLTGSIGVIMEIPNVSGLMEKIGVDTQVVKSGKHKDMASAFKSLSPEEKKILQSVLDDVHDQFITAVSEGRDMSYDDIKTLADGRIFTGRMAKDLGLVDELGGLEDAIKLAGKMGGIEGKPEVIFKEDPFDFKEFLKGYFPSELLSNTFSGIRLQYLMAP